MKEGQPSNFDPAIIAAETEGMFVHDYELPVQSNSTRNEQQGNSNYEIGLGQREPRRDHGFYEYPQVEDNIAAERMAGGE